MNDAAPRTPGCFQLLTSPGPAAIAIMRVRGPGCRAWVDQYLRSYSRAKRGELSIGRIYRARLLDQEELPVDDVIFSVHQITPHLDVRVHLHGSIGVVACCREILTEAGFVERTAPPTDLWPADNAVVAEAYAAMPSMRTLDGVRWLSRQTDILPDALRRLIEIDDDDSIRDRCRDMLGRACIVERFSQPLRIALVGPPNVGKSTLANALADREVSVVSPTPGATRDWVEIPGQIDGFPVLWLDTAGLWRGGNELDAEAMRRTRGIVASADVLALIFDRSCESRRVDFLAVNEIDTDAPVFVVNNKCDLSEASSLAGADEKTNGAVPEINISALQKSGLNELEQLVLSFSGMQDVSLDAPAPFTPRQTTLLEQAARVGGGALRSLLEVFLHGRDDADD